MGIRFLSNVVRLRFRMALVYSAVLTPSLAPIPISPRIGRIPSTSSIRRRSWIVCRVERRYGNAGRDVTVGPGIIDMDFSIAKNFKLIERQQIEFRAEFFNIPNHPISHHPAQAPHRILRERLPMACSPKPKWIPGNSSSV